MGAHQVERRRFALPVRQQLHQASGLEVAGDIQVGLIGDAMAGQCPAPHDFTVIAQVIARHLDFLEHGALAKVPGVVGAPLAHVAQRVVLRQLRRGARRTMARQVVGAGAGDASMIGHHRQRHQAGVPGDTETQGDVDGFAEQVGIAVVEHQLQTDVGVLELERIQPAQYHVAPEIRRRRQLQQPGQAVALLPERLLTLGQRRQRLAHAVEVTPTLFGQAHAACGARQQATAQAGFQALEGDAGGGRAQPQAARGGRQAAGVGGANKDFQVENRAHL